MPNEWASASSCGVVVQVLCGLYSQGQLVVREVKAVWKLCSQDKWGEDKQH